MGDGLEKQPWEVAKMWKRIEEEAMARRQPHEIFAASRPRKGDPITYRGAVVGKVTRVEDELCYRSYPDGTSSPFIWCFRDGLNKLHDWPTKQPHHRQCGDPWTQEQQLECDA